jgi:aerobic-type carbon monoxide dehydrogenase small subunit (CoxS/CutS family)
MTHLLSQKVAHRLSINGTQYEVLLQSNDTLLEVIRYKLDLIGTKQGCDKGDCGACTVLANGRPILSCLSLAQNFDDHEAITTIEGLCYHNEPDLLLKAFEKCGALQCGFCQPGMILSAKALLDENNSPSLQEIKQALSGNLCRCTGYTKIYLAIFCASLVRTKTARNLDDALSIMKNYPIHLGDV